MEQLLTIFLVSGIVLLAAGTGLHRIHRGVIRKKNDFRIRQALLRGLENPDGVPRRSMPILQW